jgi:hypothetical protein
VGKVMEFSPVKRHKAIDHIRLERSAGAAFLRL